MTNTATDQDQSSSGSSSLANDPELLGDFILESMEHLRTIESQLLTLEQDPSNTEAIHAIFRGFHTIKGLAGFLELDAVQQVAHEVETVLDLARNWRLVITPRVIDRILEGKDYLEGWLIALERKLKTGVQPPMPDNANLLEAIRELTHLVSGKPAAEVDQVAKGLQELSQAVSAHQAQENVPERNAKQSAGRSEVKINEGKLVKVDTAKLDFLVDMVGEMVIAQSLIRHDPDLANDTKPRLARNLSQLARITEDVQKTAMSMRMVPIGQLFQRMGRLIRDLSKKFGKQVELELSGEDTELDRNIVEELSDPLMHMVRNAIDHGIESVEERRLAGKDPVARVYLRAAHQAGQIIIEVSDDGHGLDKTRILAKARKNGLVADGQEMSEHEIFNLIFQPGFSTAEQVTDVSGRGVGMDVVRRHLQQLRGRIDIESVPGKGTKFLLKLPLTMAIIDGLVVGVGSERYIVPIYAIREMLRPTEDMISTVQGRSEMALVRGSLLPIVRLHEKFNVKPRSVNPWEALLIVSENSEKRFCMLVDDLIGKQEVVIKSLGPTLQGIAGVAGGAILGDGRVGLILDLEGLFGATSK